MQVISALVGFVLLPYIIRHLGPQDYGIYQLARSSMVFFMFLQLGMGPTLTRYFAKSIAKNDRDEIRIISSTAQLFLGALGGIAALSCLFMIPLFLRFYEIPPELTHETSIMLTCLAFSLFVNLNVIVPQGIVLGLNHYDVVNGIEIFGHLFRLILVFVLFECFNPSIVFVGISILVASLWRYITLFSFSCYRWKQAVLFSMGAVHLKIFRQLVGFSSLNLANSVAATVVSQAPALIIGKLLGPEMVTLFAPAMIISGAMTGVLAQTARPLVPVASQDVVAKGGRNLGYWAISMGQFVAFIGFGMTLVFAIWGPEILSLWLGGKFETIWLVVAVMSSCVAISQIQAANYFLALGGGNILPTVLSHIMMAILIVLGLIIGVKYYGWGLIAVSFYIGICILIRNILYLSYAYSKQFSYPYSKYLLRVYIVPSFLAGTCILLGWIGKYLLNTTNPLEISFIVSIVLAFYGIVGWFFVLPSPIKRWFSSCAGR